MRQEEWTVEAADAYLNEIPKFTSEKHTAEGLRRMLSYLNALPQEERIVHVAGTNGKGSVCSFLDAVLQKAGKRTARFTSPHLVRVTATWSSCRNAYYSGEVLRTGSAVWAFWYFF